MAQVLGSAFSLIKNGEEYKYFCDNIDIIKDSPSSTVACNDALRAISHILGRCFNIEVTLTILDTRLDNEFFGVNMYPDYQRMRELIDIICNDTNEEDIIIKGQSYARPIDAIDAVWRDIDKWHIDLDAKLFYDLSHRFNPKEIVALIISRVENTIFSFDIPRTVYRSIRYMMLNSSYSTQALSRSTLCRNFYIIPFIQACGFVNYKMELDEASLLRQNERFVIIYNEALTKIVTGYTSSIIDRKPSELKDKITYILGWVFEAVTDLKYQMSILKKHLEEQINAEKSFYVKNLLITIYRQFAGHDIHEITSEAFVPVVDTPELKKLNEAYSMRKFTDEAKAILENSQSQLLDKLGRCKRVTQEEIDILRLEIDKIQSVDDKIYYMEKVYDKLAIVEYALTLIGEKDTKGKVRDTKDKLLKQREMLMEIRQAIIAKTIAPERYGLFVKTSMPEGYEG